MMSSSNGASSSNSAGAEDNNVDSNGISKYNTIIITLKKKLCKVSRFEMESHDVFFVISNIMHSKIIMKSNLIGEL